jgi:hypothetical protein
MGGSSERSNPVRAHIPSGYVTISFAVSDANGHIWEYEMAAERGHGLSDNVAPGPRGYSQSPASFPPAPYQAPNTALKSFGGGSETWTYYPPEDCCYEFRIRAGKRVTNGYFFPSLADYDSRRPRCGSAPRIGARSVPVFGEANRDTGVHRGTACSAISLR